MFAQSCAWLAQDYQCNFDGRLRPYLECSCHSTYDEPQYVCVQYPDLCNPSIVRNYTVPLQRAYLQEYTAGGAHQRKGNGGFFFSCCAQTMAAPVLRPLFLREERATAVHGRLTSLGRVCP